MTTVSTEERVAPAHRRWLIMAAMGGVIGVILLDETVVGVALPTIRHDLGLSQVAEHWVVNAYLLVFACLAAVGGRLGDIIGLRPVFLVGVVIFAVASAAAGLAANEAWILAARAVQGVGAAVIFPISMVMITKVFPPERRGVALGVYAAIGTVFLALGPLVGGLFTDLVSWRWIFFINPPIVAVIVIVAVFAFRTEPPLGDGATHIDFAGALTLAGGLGVLVVAIMEGPEWGWTGPAIIALVVVGIVVLIGFVMLETRTATPLVDVTLFRHGTVTVGNLIIFTGQFNQMAIVIFGALYFQEVLCMDPLTAGTALLVGVGAVPFVAAPTGRLTDRYGGRPVAMGGLVLALIAFLGIALLIGFRSYALLVPLLVVWGIGNGSLFIAPRRAVLGVVPVAQHGEAGGVLMTSQLLGGTLGVAVCGALLVSGGDFFAVFLAPACLTLAVLALTWRYVAPDAPAGRAGGGIPAPAMRG